MEDVNTATNTHEEVQPYKDMSKMTKEELFYYLQKPYTTESGIIVKTNFNENGDSLTDIMTEYLRKILNKLYEN